MTKGIRKGLTPGRILKEAFALVDAGGASALTMRALAKRLDAAAMAIYNHYEDRDAILDALAEQVFAEFAACAAAPPFRRQANRWKPRLRAIVIEAQTFASRHPHIYRLAMSRPHKPAAAFRLTEDVLAILRDNGFSRKRAITIYTTFVILLQGFPFWKETEDRRTTGNPGCSGAEEQFRNSIDWLLEAAQNSLAEKGDET